MPRWIGLLGSWALLVLGLGIAGIAAAGTVINLRDARKVNRLEVVDRLIAERNAERVDGLRKNLDARASQVSQLEQKVTGLQQAIEDQQDTDQTILVSTAENKVYVKRGDQTVYEAICSTGKGTTLIDGGRTMVFRTPIGKFSIKSKEENPVWVPPDWHYVEEANKRGMRVVRLQYGESIDAYTGGPVRSGSWWESGSSATLKVSGKDVMVVSGGSARALPPGEIITAGGAIVIPPVGTRQRQHEKVLGRFRLNLGDGYALHGTQAVDDLGRSVSHGCVRLGDKDIEHLYNIANVGDEVIIY